MIINNDTMGVLTARQLPKMVLIEADISNNKLTLMGQLSDPISVDLSEVARKGIVLETKYVGKHSYSSMNEIFILCCTI